MQSVGLQTVLQMSNVGERVQQTALTHGAVVSDQFKDIIEKANDLRKTEVHETGEMDQVKIRPDAERQRQRREAEREAKEKGEKREHEETAAPSMSSPADALVQGRILDIKI